MSIFRSPSTFSGIFCLKGLGTTSPLCLSITQIRTATKRVSGSKTNKNDSAGRRLGPKAYEGHFVKPGQIIMRQRGTKIHPGENVGIGKDHTIFALEPGFVTFYRDPFHPLRKYVGIALKKNLTLPSPHFAPRLRRFGYVEISDPEEAQREESHMSRKEFYQQNDLAKLKSEREKKEINLKTLVEATLRTFVELNEDEMSQSIDRILKISQMVKRSKIDAKVAGKHVSFEHEYNLELATKRGELDKAQAEALTKNYAALVEKLDEKVTVDVNGVLCEKLSPETIQKERETILADLEKRFSNIALSDETRMQIRRLIRTPGIFDLEAQAQLKDLYLPHSRPLWAMDNVAEVADEHNAPKGAIRVYDEIAKKVKLLASA